LNWRFFIDFTREQYYLTNVFSIIVTTEKTTAYTSADTLQTIRTASNDQTTHYSQIVETGNSVSTQQVKTSNILPTQRVKTSTILPTQGVNTSSKASTLRTMSTVHTEISMTTAMHNENVSSLSDENVVTPVFTEIRSNISAFWVQSVQRRRPLFESNIQHVLRSANARLPELERQLFTCS